MELRLPLSMRKCSLPFEKTAASGKASCLVLRCRFSSFSRCRFCSARIHRSGPVNSRTPERSYFIRVWGERRRFSFCWIIWFTDSSLASFTVTASALRAHHRDSEHRTGALGHSNEREFSKKGSLLHRFGRIAVTCARPGGLATCRI